MVFIKILNLTMKIVSEKINFINCLIMLMTNSKCFSVSTNNKTGDIYWWLHQPYTALKNDLTIKYKNFSEQKRDVNINNNSIIPFFGFYKAVLHRLKKECIKEEDNYTWNFLRVSNSINFKPAIMSEKLDNEKVLIFLPFSAPSTIAQYVNVDDDVNFFLPLIQDSNSIYFFMRGEEASVGIMAVIAHGWPLLTLIILGAAYSGIIIWLLDRLWNEANFPKPFIRGFWEGFWWAFVTMTTVGYGDTTPKSIQARIYGLIWIVAGITILSVFTATVTTVLTQESMVKFGIEGSKVAVLNGTEDFRRSLEKGAEPIVCNSFDEILLKIRNNEARGGLVNHFSFSSQQDKLVNSTMLLEQSIDNPVMHGILFKGLHMNIRNCMKTVSLLYKEEFINEMDKWTKPLVIYKTNAVASSQGIFQPNTLMIMWYAAAIWLGIFILFVIWEFKIWRPKHEKRQEMKRRMKTSDSSLFIVQPGATVTDMKQFENLNIKDNIRKAVSYNNVVNINGGDTVNDSLKLSNKTIYNNKLQGRQITETNFAFSYDDFGNKLIDTHVPQQQQQQQQPGLNLQSLMLRQSQQLLRLYDEHKDWKLKWDKKLKDLQKLHRKEQRLLLKLSSGTDTDSLKTDENQWPTVCI